MDDLDHIYTTSVLSELLTMLKYRGPHNPTWVDTVYNRQGEVLYPAGTYYLKNEIYFIGTRTQARSVFEEKRGVFLAIRFFFQVALLF